MNEVKLNQAQESAVRHREGPMLVVAGAGTGKTKVIVERLVKLVESGVPKSEILCLTFTEKATQEMLDRASERLTLSYGLELNIFTFNGFGAEVLREFGTEIGLSGNLKLVGDTGKVVFLREHIDELDLDYFAPISKPDSQLATLGEYFSQLKQQLVKPQSYLEFAKKLPEKDEAESLEAKKHQELARAYQAYLELAAKNNIIDYDDQLYLLVQLLEKRPNVLKSLQQRYHYIMVDEFQDTNPMQSRVIDLLAGNKQNILAVGDDDQSIYGWRGATLANILEFKQRYPHSKEITLIENFRSTQEILDGAWSLIQLNNPNRLESMNKLDKRLIANRGKGIPPSSHCFARLDLELDWVAQEINRKIKAGTEPGHIAVLARSKNGVRRVSQMLENHSIEHSVSGVSSDLYQEVGVRTMIEALKSIVDIGDNRALYHTLGSSLFNIEPRILSEASRQARMEHTSLWEILSSSSEESVKSALELINSWRKLATTTNIRSVAYDILVDSGLKAKLLDDVESDAENAQTAHALGIWFTTLVDFERVSGIPSVQSYIDSLDALRADGQLISDEIDNLANDKVSVLTIHKAKGLEWEVVFIVDCTEGSFPLTKRGRSLKVPEPLAKTVDADDHYNEERRLAYVATTRARDELIITCSESHNGITKRKPSRFIAEFFGHDELAPNEHLSSIALNLMKTGGGETSSIPLPDTMKQGENIVLSASKADDYLQCPRNFYYKHVLEIPEEISPATEIGSLFHSIAEDINKAKLEGTELPSLEVVQKRLNDLWPKTGYQSKKHLDRALKLGNDSLPRFYNQLINEDNPVAVEEKFSIHIPDSRMILKGRIDAVFPFVSKNRSGVEIRDYKTTASAKDPASAKSRASSSNQLVMYALAWRLLHDEDPMLVTLDFVQTGVRGSVQKRSDSLDKMQSKLAQAAEDILAGRFPPGEKHDYCIHP